MFKNLKDLELKDKDILEKYFSPDDLNASCEYSFNNIFIWRNVCGTKWTLANDKLFIVYTKENSMLMPPSPYQLTPETLYAFYKNIFPENNAEIIHVTEKYTKKYKSVNNLFTPEIIRDQADYIHLTDNLVNLKGQAFHKKKNLLNQFLRNNPDYECIRVKKNMLDDCFSLAKLWCEIKNCNDIGITHEKFAMDEAFRHYEELAFDGLALIIENRIAAFSIFTRLFDTCIVHFEKYDRNIKGIAQAINWETAKYVQNSCRYINREQDLGIPGLRQAKISYNPDIISCNFRLSPR